MLDTTTAFLCIPLHEHSNIRIREQHKTLSKICQRNILKTHRMEFIGKKTLDLLYTLPIKVLRNLRQNCITFRTNLFMLTPTHRLRNKNPLHNFTSNQLLRRIKRRFPDNGIHLRKEIRTGTRRWHQLTMSDDGITINRQAIVRTQIRKQHSKALDLLIRRLCLLKVSADMHAYRMAVIAIRVCSYRPIGTAELHCAVLADNIVIADARPPTRLMRRVNLRRRKVVVRRIPGMMHDNLIGRVTCFELVCINV
nr:MAG TPA: hypothetical protein [Caudoviricetes sp.]